VPREYLPPDRETLRWAAHSLHPRARVSSVTPLLGGLTAHMDRITVESPTGLQDLVLRRWPGDDWADGLVTREASALAAVRGCDIPAPELLGADEDGAESGVRCTLTSALEGEPDLSPTDLPSWLGTLAATQAAIHAVPERSLTRWDGWYEDGAPLEWLEDSGLRAAAREAACGPLAAEQVFVHGDYQHFNVLWRNGRLSGVVDWPNAGTGSRGGDVGHCRLNLAVLFGPGAAAEYLAAYESAAGVSVDRRADLRALLCFDLAWQRFIPRQVAGRARLDVAGMPDRVAAAVQDTLDGIG
jgi:aminoglycoside phosphotransferase (APT) family kinase protein